MTPEKCLEHAGRFLAAGQLDRCRYALRLYRSWRVGGAVQPEHGDLTYMELQIKLEAAEIGRRMSPVARRQFAGEDG